MSKLRPRVTTAFLVLFSIPFIFSGCGGDVPGCADIETKVLVLKIVRENLENSLGKENSDSIKLDIKAIRTQSVDDNTGKCECAAELILKKDDKEKSQQIMYTSENLEDEPDKFYVTVSGL